MNLGDMLEIYSIAAAQWLVSGTAMLWTPACALPVTRWKSRVMELGVGWLHYLP